MKELEVSIVILSYNPDLKKLLSTVKSAIAQKNICFEIVIADDGSTISYKENIIEFFKMLDFKSFKLVINDTNQGTVKNAISGIRAASGEYVYLTSQGDCIFDEYAMSDFYHFAKSKKARICFGDYIGYSYSTKLKIFNENLLPPITCVYNKPLRYYKTSFFLGGNILGATYFRERVFALESFEFISKYSIYTEDGPSTAYALVNNINVYYFPRKIVWYENNTGISNSGGSWYKRICSDIYNSYNALLKSKPKDSALDAGVMLAKNNLNDVNGAKAIAKIFIRHPIICTRKKIVNRMPKREITLNKTEIDFLNNLVEEL